LLTGLQDAPRSDPFLRFLVDELKPTIDRRFSTLPDAQNNYLMGSSLGGLVSVYALCEYPQVFSAAAGLSTHWIGTFERNREVPDAAISYLQEHLPDPATHRLYLDRGDAGLDALYDDAQARINSLLQVHGYGDDRFQSHVFAGAEHNEKAWHQRLETPLLFLLGTH
jgi:enterochelin esterase-like enzyme